MTKKWDRVLIFGLLLAGILSMAAGFDNECETVRENVLRLHILANSDSEEDQALKLRCGMPSCGKRRRTLRKVKAK